jgi:predicted ester cyclase
MARQTWQIALIFAGTLGAGCQSELATKQERNVPLSNSTTSTNRETVRRLFEEGMNRDQVAVIDQIIGADYVDATGERGPNAFKQVMTRLRTAFPDLSYTVDDILGEGDKVAVRWHWTGTHRGPFRGVAPTERSVTNSGAAIFHLRNGQVVASALETDRLGFLQSIGVVPASELLFKPSTPVK